MRLDHAQNVQVHLQGGVTLPALVEVDEDEVLTLVLAVRPDGTAGSLYERRATVEGISGRGVVRVSGTVEPDGERPEVLRLWRDNAARVVQRRADVRVDAVVPVKVLKVGTLPLRFTQEISTLNVSGHGLLLHDTLGLPLGVAVELELFLDPDPHSPPLELRGTVVRDAGEGRKGVHIDELSRADQQRLVRFVTERERIALRVRKTA